MPIPDNLLDHLADRYVRECIDPVRYQFERWAVVEAEKLGFRF
ncbi:hypothetical protein [Paenibacillus alvei]|nr:hypothetical protein [Paenibacillus alvei]